ncbi:MAG: MBL fold metallo-hydrolase [Patescibacteria group bacterium]
MNIKFLGAAGTVTGSSYALTSGSGRSILIDLGMFQGPQQIEQLNYEPYEYDCSKLVGMVLTHAHLDHCGRLPILLPKGFKGNIWMTTSTRDLTELSLLDTAKIAKEDEKPILFDKELAQRAIEQFKTVEYRTPVQMGDFTITFRDAGHILGSASLEIEDKSPNSEIRKIIFSGDLGNTPEDLLEATETIDTADAVVMESTYGDRLHPKQDPTETIQSEINAVETSGGTLLIPSFSLNRTQEILHIIRHLKRDGKISPQTLVFLDSPMAEKATRIYMNYRPLFNAHIREDFKTGSPFEFPGYQELAKQAQSQAIEEQSGPKVIIAGSGMMTGGRIVRHAAHYLPIASTRLLIVGYQGIGTLGRELLDGKKDVGIEGRSVHVTATVTDTQAMSSHADQSQLLDWLGHIQHVKKVFLTHGDNVPREALSLKIKEALQLTDITMPTMNQEISF